MSKQVSHFDNHKISSSTRARFIDWLLIVFDILKLSDATFFLTIDIMDLYLFYTSKEKTQIGRNDLYLIGITCLHIACKKEEVKRVPLDLVLKDLGKNLYNR